MTEPVQLTIDGQAVPYKETLEPSSREDLEVSVSITGLCDFDATMSELYPEGYSTNAQDFVDELKSTYGTVSKLRYNWSLENRWELVVRVLDPKTGKSTVAQWVSHD